MSSAASCRASTAGGDNRTEMRDPSVSGEDARRFSGLHRLLCSANNFDLTVLRLTLHSLDCIAIQSMNFKKGNKVLQKLSSEKSANLGRISASLSREKVERRSSARVAGKLSDKVTASSDERSGSKESSSFSGLSKEHGRENKYTKENHRRHGKTEESVKCTMSSGSAERSDDERAEYDKKKERTVGEVSEKEVPQRKARPYYYNDLLDGVPESLQSSEEDLSQAGAESSRPFCYDEFLDGLTRSLMNSAESEANEIVTATRESECSLMQPPSHTQKTSRDNNRSIKVENVAENATEESEVNVVQGRKTKMSNKFVLLRGDPSFLKSTDKSALSAQKLVSGEDVTDFTLKYISSKKSSERAMKLEHKFLWQQQRHISDFCRSEAAGPTEQSLIDFFRMLWQCHVLLVICLEPLTDPKTCYPYFSFKKEQVVKARARISLETREVIQTAVANLCVYEAVLTNLEIKGGVNKRCVYIMQYDKWTHEKAISPDPLVKMIRVMEEMHEKKREPIVVHSSHGIRRAAIFVVTSLLIRQIAETNRLSVLKAALAVRRRRYGVLRLLADYRLVLQSALCYARQRDLIRNEKIFMDAIDILECRSV
ncbi:unnamed protein product [Litomosoides sigmodontis]|uniref:Tyrosine-protein phosphatase domain-containing protein n=1 Tax=Litomosoides sigmodontis TaxID=42156 RepID=A0A3P6SE38_LITSI|nr:unnamed protein product [Litomosoides sigmodontis]